jgi:hypothetical protein
MFLLEGIRDVFQEDQAENDVLIFGGIEVAAELVGGGPKGGFKAEFTGTVGFLLLSFKGGIRVYLLAGTLILSQVGGTLAPKRGRRQEITEAKAEGRMQNAERTSQNLGSGSCGHSAVLASSGQAQCVGAAGFLVVGDCLDMCLRSFNT